jgi:hypothetical protein
VIQTGLIWLALYMSGAGCWHSNEPSGPTQPSGAFEDLRDSLLVKKDSAPQKCLSLAG